ncbi:S-(hydroxymethyl)glutathione dehydrogenase / alcohol dehydrogenase [Microlunatus flavus]|uniref:S-(Hydroxymethyl)glutathione dehydrogenase / alcohol dehydrogenase n=1 Tax=Microlunatus flavus TaxID=1036181 RepID=A0A1H9A9L0_9ACTN|nr:S-(hydroxymethyl)glutathione dehydrogenase / alcohol dehydrogenase [Microlunatus flavus]
MRERSGPFRVEELRRPEPRDGEVLVEVAACGVCHTDLHVHDGSVAFPLPAVLGHEVSGTVRAVGRGVEHLSEGDAVVGAFIMPCGRCRMCTRGREELCEPFFAQNRLNGTLYDGTTRLFDADGAPVAMYSMGGLAEHAVMPALAAAPIPAGAPLADSAILGCAFLTAYGALVHVGDVQPGASVAVIGAGGVGLSLVAVAKALGAAQVVAVDLADDRLRAATELGATATVNGRTQDVVATVRDLTGGGADVVVEAIGQPATFRQATEVVADGGRCVMIGIAPVGRTAEVEITRLVRRKIQVCGSFGGRPRTDLAHLGRLVADGRLDPGALISRRFALGEADEAYRLLAEGRIVGRALVEMDRPG